MMVLATRLQPSWPAAAQKHPNIRLIENPGNRGKGYSVRSGMLQARGAIVMFTDADLSAPIEEAESLFTAIANGADVAIGSRWLDRSRQTLRQPLYRRFFGRCFNWLTRLIMNLPLADTQCGFKAFRREAAQTIFIRQRIERWGFDPEILYIALRLGMRIDEVPVTWGHDERTRISYLKDGLKMLEDLLKVRFYSLAGYYRADPYQEVLRMYQKKCSSSRQILRADRKRTAAPLPGKQKLNALESGIAVDTYCETGDAFFLTIELPDRHPS